MDMKPDIESLIFGSFVAKDNAKKSCIPRAVNITEEEMKALTKKSSVELEKKSSEMSNSSKDSATTRARLGNLNPVFRKREKEEDNKVLTKSIIQAARLSGTLNLSGRGLASVPEKVFTINMTEKLEEVTLQSLVTKEEDAWWNYVPLTNLDLSSNMLSAIQPEINKLEALTTLNLQNNALTSIPKEIGDLLKLTRINLSRNKLKDLPMEFFKLPIIHNINISYNEFVEFHTAFTDLHMLEVLDASYNKLTALPCGMGYLVRLKDLNLAGNRIREIPPDFVNMRCLQKMDLMHNGITILPNDMCYMRHLQCVYLQHNNIEVFPDISDCHDLIELHFAHNAIAYIPEKICGKLPHLKVLDLRNNKIVKVPNEIALLTNLIRLDLSNNSITALPNSLSQLSHLTSLQLEGNPLKTIRRDVLQCGTARVLKILRDRAIASNQLEKKNSTPPKNDDNDIDILKSDGDGVNNAPSEYDENIFPDKYKMRKTRSLIVTFQNLTDIPDEVFQVAAEERVTIVDFSKNRLKKLPNGMIRLGNSCTELTLANNTLEIIDTFISQFRFITMLNLSCNNLSDLPDQLGYATTLRELNANNNLLKCIPRCIYKLTNLEILLVSDNRIDVIDVTENGLGSLKHLSTLNLRNNDIQQVPPFLGKLQNITHLEILGNPFRQPRHQILQKGTEAIMAYLRDRIPIDQRN